jgi:hypothetical protein
MNKQAAGKLAIRAMYFPYFTIRENGVAMPPSDVRLTTKQLKRIY